MLDDTLRKIESIADKCEEIKWNKLRQYEI